MAVPCRQCETPVDENAAICPTCGATNPAARVGAPSAAGVAYGRGAGPGEVVITGVNIPFGEMVVLIIKIMFAAIPAYIIMFVIFMVLFGLLGAIFGAFMPGFLDSMSAGIEG